MKKALGFLFALALFLLPIAWGSGVRAEDVISSPATTTDSSSASSTSSTYDGPFFAIRNFFFKSLMGQDEVSPADKVNADNAKNKLAELRDRIQELLKKLNNTSL